ncbi:hypothetical protein [Helicobacter typhlonius]|uniref:hypothetical protein n=1 Tax=Helicobacter typhlonius TaxID=76936 RepID=UPI002FE3BB29
MSEKINYNPNRYVCEDISRAISFYIHNLYAIVGYGANGAEYRIQSNRKKIQIQSVSEALQCAKNTLQARKRLNQLVLIAPPPCILELEQFLHFLDSQGVKIDIYIGEKECQSMAILESLCACSVVRFYKNTSFTHCISNIKHSH